jgi:hypothetical protein
VAREISTGTLTVDALRNGAATTRALPPECNAPAPIPEPQKPAALASAEGLEEAAELLDDFLIALLDLLGDTWPEIAAALPDEVFDRIDRWMEVRLS